MGEYFCGSFSLRNCIECRALKSFQFFHLIKTFHELHEDPNFVPIIVHEEVVDLVEVVRLLDEHDKYLLFETRSFHSTFEYFFCHHRPGIREKNLCLTISENLLSL